MLHDKTQSLRYFWFTNTLFWLAVLGVMTHVQYTAIFETEYRLTWVQTWLRLSPWYLAWIPLTGAIFSLVRYCDKQQFSKIRSALHYFTACVLLLPLYWLFATAVRQHIRDLPYSQLLADLVDIVMSSAQLDLIIFAAVLALALALRFYHNAISKSVELKRLQGAFAQEQLKALRSQLNPHFLFNTLNTIASLIRLKQQEQAIFALSQLSNMLRQVLESKNDQDVKVKDEVAFIQSYIEIQKLRFRDKLQTSMQINDDCLELEIPNMLLQPLVENAIQHGSQLESNNNPVNIEIFKQHNILNIVMINRVAQASDHKGFGIGIKNTRARLERLYGDFKLELDELNNELFQTTLKLPIGGRCA
jgi:hypothetical protein